MEFRGMLLRKQLLAGVETSPPTSPDAPYKAVQPVFLPKRPSSDRFQRPNADERLAEFPEQYGYQENADPL